MTKVSAQPTKDFFISMLTRDISLLSALVDLIDNSVDAALMQGSADNKLIEIEANDSYFCIKDNCGGISKTAAENYAFKFGRPIDAPTTPHSVGRFGVGMKRALFKVGKKFNIESHHSEHSFKINVDVNQWLNAPDAWSFELEEISKSGDGFGTNITVTNLHESIASKLGDRSFINDLKVMIGKAHYKALAGGIKITVNNEEVSSYDIKIKTSEELGIVGESFEVDGVKVAIKAGVGERDIRQGGWYVFCNDRLIEGASQSTMTGWGVDGVRSYHADFAYFRGVIEFHSIDGAKLPWNTTKTGIDTDNPIYRSAKVKMKLAMRKVIALLSERVKEQAAVERGNLEESAIDQAIEAAELKSAFELDIPDVFVRPSYEQIPRNNSEKRISYSVKDSDLNTVKESLGVTTNKDVGLFTFRYYLESEC